MNDLAHSFVSESWKSFKETATGGADQQQLGGEDDFSFSDELHGTFLVHFIANEPFHRESPAFKEKAAAAAAESQDRSGDADADAVVGPTDFDPDWPLAVASALDSILLRSAEAGPVDTRDILMQLQAFSSQQALGAADATSGGGGGGNFLTCGNFFELEKDEAVEVWSRSLVLCEVTRRMLEHRAERGQRVVPWISTALSLLRVDDVSHKMPPAYLCSAVSLLRISVRECQASIEESCAAKQKKPTTAARPLSLPTSVASLLCLSLKLRWQQFRGQLINGETAAATTFVTDCLDLRRALRELDCADRDQKNNNASSKSTTTTTTMTSLLHLAAELGVVRAAARCTMKPTAYYYSSSYGGGGTAAAAAASSQRGAAPAALQGRFLQTGNLAGALSNGVCAGEAPADPAQAREQEEAESNMMATTTTAAASDPDAARRGRAMLLHAARRKEQRLKKMREAEFKFLSSSSDGEEGAGSSSSAEQWRKQQEAALQAADSGISEDTARIKAFLEQTVLGSGPASDSGSVASQQCCLVEPLVAAGWLIHALELAQQKQKRSVQEDESLSRVRLLLVLNVFTHASPCLQQTFDAPTISHGLVGKLALGDTPMYSISCEQLPESVRRLGFLSSAGERDGGGGDDGETARILKSKADSDAEKRGEIISAFMDTLKEAVVSRRGALGESIALALQTLAWLVSQPHQEEPQQQRAPPPSMILVQGMNSLLQRCDENTRFKIVSSLLVLSPHDSFSTTFLGAFRFCILDDLQLCEKGSGNNHAVARHDLRSPFLDGALVLTILAAAVGEWCSTLKNFWFRMRSESCMVVLQILGSLRGVDTRLKKLLGSSSGLFDWSSEQSTRANRRALLCAKECIVDTIEKEINSMKEKAALNKNSSSSSSNSSSKDQQEEEQNQQQNGSATISRLASSQQEMPEELMLHQFSIFLNMAVQALASFDTF